MNYAFPLLSGRNLVTVEQTKVLRLSRFLPIVDYVPLKPDLILLLSARGDCPLKYFATEMFPSTLDGPMRPYEYIVG